MASRSDVEHDQSSERQVLARGTSEAVERSEEESGSVLVGDIGGTRARFGIVDSEGRLVEVRILSAADYPTLIDAASDYLAGFEADARPKRGAIAVACPVLGDRVQMTNHPWSFSIGETCHALGLRMLEVVNDFIALALALPVLREEHSRVIKPGERETTAPLALLGPGTGLGVSALIPVAQGWIALPTEGGHRDLAATTEREWQIVERLQRRYGHVSAERVLSGPGLINLYRAICELDGVEPSATEPEGVVARSMTASCVACDEAVAVFSRQLGAVAGDLALTLGARGGVYLGGGVLHGMDSTFDVGLFREGFLDKGRFREYVDSIPVRMVLNPTAALLGAARALEYDFTAGVRATGR